MQKKLYIFVFIAVIFLGIVPFTKAQVNTSTFNVSLSYGSTQKDEVLKLQNFLYSLGYLKVAPTGLYLSLTQQAVADFQKAEGISPAVGYFGPTTRGVANQKVLGLNTQTAPKAEVNIESVTSEQSGAAPILSSTKIIRWRTTNYPVDAGVNINLLRKVSDQPLSYTLVRVISTNTTDDGIETWIPRTGENTPDLYIEVACSSTYSFRSGCQFTSSPIKI